MSCVYDLFGIVILPPTLHKDEGDASKSLTEAKACAKAFQIQEWGRSRR